MSEQRLFSVGKVPVFLDSYTPGLEVRRGEDVKIITLSLRIQPFDAKLAAAIDDGLHDDSGVRLALFKSSSPEMRPHLRRVDFALACPRQRMVMFATPDSSSRQGFDQVKIAGTYARLQKDVNGWAFCFRASFGPVDRTEMEYIHEWMLGQRFVTFEAAQPNLDLDERAADTSTRPLAPGVPAPMFDDDGNEVDAEVDTRTSDDEDARPVPRRGSAKTARPDPDREREAQRAAGASVDDDRLTH